MRVAISDYDGTMCIRGEVGEDVINAVKRWRYAGNAFGIATGRDLDMILYETERRGIPFDFLICCNGSVIYDSELNALRSVDVPDEIIADLLRHPAAMKSMHYELSSGGETSLYIRDERSWFPKVGSAYEEVSFEEALTAKGLQQISLAYFEEDESAECARDLEDAFGRFVVPQQNGVCIDISRRGVSKAVGVAEALRIFDLPERGLLAIGDGANDIPMIKRYGGFSLKHASPNVRKTAKKLYPDVGAMLREHME